MKKRLVLILIAALMVLSLTSCLDKDKMAEAFEEGKRSAYEEDEEESAAKEEASEEKTEEKTEAKEETKEDDLSDVRYAEDFKPASYKEYGSEDADTGLEGNPIYVKGEITDYEEDQNVLVLEADDGEWIVDCGSDMSDEIKKELKGYKGEKMRVFGTFKGYSKAWSKPVITILKDVPKYACRIEDMDGKKRITYLDTQWEPKEADKDYTLGSLGFKGVSSWEMEATDEDATFVPLPGYTGMIAISRFELPDEYSGWKDDEAEDVLDKIAEEYMEGAEIYEQKKTKAGGLNAIRYITTIADDDYPSEMIMYVILARDGYYCIMFGEPYLLGTALSDYEEEFMDSLKAGEPESAADKEDKKAEKETSKTDKETEKESKDKDKKEEESKDKDKKEEESKDKDKKEEESKDKEEKTEAKKSGKPTRSEISGKTFYATLDVTVTDGVDVDNMKESNDLMFDSSELAGYDESSGTMTINEDGLSFLLSFSYNSKGKIVFSGPAAFMDPDVSGYGTMSGYEK